MAEMSKAQFEVVAELLRSREPVKSAVRMVLLKGVSTKDAAEKTDLAPQSVSNALRRYRNAHKKLLQAYISA